MILQTDGSFNYTPAQGFVGTDTFQYYDTDINPVTGVVTTSNTATVSLYVINPGAPTAPFLPGGLASGNHPLPAAA